LVQRRIGAIVATVNQALSPYDEASELSRFNLSSATDWVPATPPLRRVLGSALRIAAVSDGAFDPTVGPIVGRYGFGPIAGAEDGAYRELAVGAAAIRKTRGDVTIDLCGIAKGYALDLIREELDRAGLESFLIELGGEVFARGRHPSGRPWQVAIEQPAALNATLGHLITLEERSVATSGVTLNSYDLAGRRYSHVIDARRRGPVTGGTLSASVLSEEGMDADGLATALVAVQPEEAVALAERLGLDAALYLYDGEATHVVMTGCFNELLIA
jgi:thiamine biosynthesis lipoprotein